MPQTLYTVDFRIKNSLEYLAIELSLYSKLFDFI